MSDREAKATALRETYAAVARIAKRIGDPEYTFLSHAELAACMSGCAEVIRAIEDKVEKGLPDEAYAAMERATKLR